MAAPARYAGTKGWGWPPVKARQPATGVAWMMAIGRFGVIAGSLLIGELARRELGASGPKVANGNMVVQRNENKKGAVLVK